MSLRAFVKPKKSLVINTGPRPLISLGQITDIDASDAQDGEALVYEELTNKYVVKPILIDSNNVINISIEKIADIDASGAEDGEALIYDAALNKYVVKPIVVDSNNITTLTGGSF
jgi:hypothetical protein